MREFAGVRFPHVLAASERDAVVHALRSVGADVTSWNDAGEQTFALVALEGATALETLRETVPGADVALPPRAVLRIRCDRSRQQVALVHALVGPGRPVGVVASATESDAVVVELDVQKTPLALLVHLVDIVSAGRSRRIEAVLPLGDDVLCALAGASLGEPNLTATRLIETHLAPILAGEGA